MNKLYLIRGLPGSGKTTLGGVIARDSRRCFSADDYFTDEDGEYNFDPTKLKEAHADCQMRARRQMASRLDFAVANTFSQSWEAEPYFRMAEECGYDVCVVECQNDFGSIHGVPESSIEAMRERWEPLKKPPSG